MSPLFKLVIQTMVLHAHIVADRYHVCRLVDWAIEQKIDSAKNFFMSSPPHLTKSLYIMALCQVLGTATNPFSFFHIRTV